VNAKVLYIFKSAKFILTKHFLYA